MTKTALICGISGQDGSYLAQLLLDLGYKVAGTSREAAVAPFRGLVQLGIRDRVQLHSKSITDFRSVYQVLKNTEPDESYNLSGQSSVGLSFEQPVETLESIAIGTTHTLKEFVATAFKHLGLNWQDFVQSDPKLFRATDITMGRGNPAKATKELGWRATLQMEEVIVRMIRDRRAKSE